MTFIVHQVSRRATGGEIARTRTLETATPVIGRGAECEIHLPDLTVDLRHVRLSEGSDGQVLVEALGKLGFVLDGHFTRRAELDLIKDAHVGIGRYRLVISRETTGAVKISISGVAGGAGASFTKGEAAIFSPRASALSRRPLAWAMGVAVLLLCIAIPVTLFLFAGSHRTIHADQQWNSGPLSKSHAFLQGDCQACHKKAFVAVRDEDCLSCHAATSKGVTLSKTHAEDGPPPRLVRAHTAARRLAAGAPLPADLSGRATVWIDKLVNHPNDRCASCHIEHAPAIGAATLTERRETPLLKTVNDCADCHRSLSHRLSDTALGDTPDWARHPDFRPLVAVGGMTARRVPLARSPSTITGLIFSHRTHLLATGGVARMSVELGHSRGYGGALDCGACHHADPKAGGFVPVRMERDCRACHALAFARTANGVQTLPHGSVRKLLEFLQSVKNQTPRAPSTLVADDQRRRPGLMNGSGAEQGRHAPVGWSAAWPTRFMREAAMPEGACGFCHRISRPPVGSLAFKVQSVPQVMRHLPEGGFDHGVTAHHLDSRGRPTCGQCHPAASANAAGALLLPSISRCAACHGAPRAPFTAKANCTECHDYHTPGRPRVSARVRQDIASWRPSLIKVSEASVATPR